MTAEDSLYNQRPDIIVLYAAEWCPDCDRVRSILEERGVRYIEVDAAKDAQASQFLEKILRRIRLPTVFFPDGTMSVEPSNEEITRHLPR